MRGPPVRLAQRLITRAESRDGWPDTEPHRLRLCFGYVQVRAKGVVRVQLGLASCGGVREYYGVWIPISNWVQRCLKGGPRYVMRVALLGELNIQSGNSVVEVSAAKQRVVLAALALRAGHPVTHSELAEALWDDASPATARVTVHNYIRRLRLILGPGAGPRIMTRSAGYQLDLGPDDVDALAFGKMCESGGRAARSRSWSKAAETLRAALEMWRGTPLADVPSQVLRLRWAEHLEQQRLQALDWRIEADLNLGLHEMVIAELRQRIAARPLRERTYALLMMALYRAGRQGEALAAFQNARGVLVDELGVEPGPELQHLHSLILSHDPLLTGISTVPPRAAVELQVPRQLPAALLGFAGRAHELAALDAMFADWASGYETVMIFVISGMAGAGKSALAVHWAYRVADRFPDGQMHVNLRGFDPRRGPVAPVQALRGLLDSLGVSQERIPVDPDLQANLYRSLVANRRMLILIDNPRDADQVRPLLPGSPGSLVLITSRGQLPSLVAVEGARLLILDVPTETESIDLLERRLGARRVEDERRAAMELTTLCARLPLALSIVAARAIAQPSLALDALATELRQARNRLDVLEAGDSAASVRAVFSQACECVSALARQMFVTLGALNDQDVSMSFAAQMAGVSVPTARRALEELAQAGLLKRALDGRYWLHDLARAYAAECAHADDAPHGITHPPAQA